MKSWADVGIDERLLSPGENKIVCPECGPRRHNPNDKSLSVNTDEKIYKCHNINDCTFSGTLKSRDHFAQDKSYKLKEWSTPNEQAYQNMVSTKLPPEVVSWFQSRGIEQETLEANEVGFGVGFSFGKKIDDAWVVDKQADGSPVQAIYFPYREDGRLVNYKVRLWSDGKAQKDFRMKSKAQKIFWQVDRVAQETLVVEGEPDLLILYQLGYHNVISVPNGASVSEYLQASSSKLQTQGGSFTLFVDGDEAGERLRDELVTRFGKDLCRIVTYPPGVKDANEVFLRYGADEVHRMVRSARYVPYDGLIEISSLADEIMGYYENGMPTGLSTGFPSLEHLYRVAPGSFTIVTGHPGSGKSTFVAQMLVNMADQHDIQIGVFSPEDSPTSSFAIKIIAKRVGKPFDIATPNRMSPEEMVEGLLWVNEHFISIAPNESTFSIDEILRLAKVAVFRHGIKILVLDPWNEIDHSRPQRLSESEYYSQVLSKIRIFARLHEVAIFLVAHPTKMDKVKDEDGKWTEAIPSLDNVSGSHHFRAKADMGMTVHRKATADEDDHSMQVYITKVRQPWHGKIGWAEFEYNKNTGEITDPLGGARRLEESAEVTKLLKGIY